MSAPSGVKTAASAVWSHVPSAFVAGGSGITSGSALPSDGTRQRTPVAPVGARAAFGPPALGVTTV